MKREIVLGINWEQNSTVALMINGKIISCVSEERFSRVKNDERYPKKAIDWILKSNQIKKKEIYKVCLISKAWSPSYSLMRHYTNFSVSDYIDEQKKIWFERIYNKKKISQIKIFKNKIDFLQFPGKLYWKNIYKKLSNKIDHTSNKEIISFGQKIRSEIIKKHLGVNSNDIEFIDHSSGHAAFAYFSKRKRRKSIVITLDAFGDFVNYSASIFDNKKNNITQKKIVKGNNFIIGRLYRYITLILGLKPNEHEYKVMGLAPYCKKEYYQKVEEVLKTFQDTKNLKFFYKSRPKDMYFDVKKKLDGCRFDSIAGGLQSYTEYLICKWIKDIIRKYKIYDICYAGGVAMNVKANLSITNLNKKINLYVPPSPDDSSQAMGACYAYYLLKNKNLDQLKPLKNAYLGPAPILEKKHLKKINLLKRKNKFKIFNKNINYEVAKQLSFNKVIGRFCGNAEFGARSLGNRSILASPLKNSIKIKINENVKNRDFWMPFAASILEKNAKKYFHINSEIENYNYMTNCLETTKLGREKLKAALHPYDLTCRPQIISSRQNEEFEDLINQFGKITGTYALLNTSFNLHGYPIVNSPSQAISILEKSNLDGLLFKDLFILKNK
jgi:carbamoyltransferase